VAAIVISVVRFESRAALIAESATEVPGNDV
jgi:hypothetical protein